MGRLVDADKVIDRLLDASEKMAEGETVDFWLGVSQGLQDAVSIIKADIPTIDPVKHGKWIRDEAGVVRCSACKKEAYFILGTYDLFACCHHCGARMEGDVDG